MITNSFIFLERIGKKFERNIWQNGISNWDTFLNSSKINGLSSHRKSYYDRKIIEARKALFNSDSAYFLDLMPNSEMWRLYDFFREESIFLDIETTGLSRDYHDLTVIGLFDGLNTKTMIKNINLDYAALKNELQKYKLIVTFNGASFDIPFIERIYPGLLPKVPHFDVKFLASKLNLKGGLKSIERQLGIQRGKIIEDFNGGDALTLWRMHKATGDDYYLKLLVEYNEFDITNLKKVAEICILKMKAQFLNKNQEK